MTDEKKPSDPKPVTEDKAASDHKITRRRFTKAGAVAPVVMTLGARPVWGQACTPSAVLSGTHQSHAPCTVESLSATAGQWSDAARTASWPTSNDFPGFDADPSDPFSSHFGTPPTTHKCSEKDTEELSLQKTLADVLIGVTGINEKLSLLARHATATRLNALYGEAFARKIGAAEGLFPVKPDAVVAAFWEAVQADCIASTSTLSTSVTKQATMKPEDSGKACKGYDAGEHMAELASELGSVNSSGVPIF